ncbi:MAG: ferritin [Planctomycetota bacterium]
MASLDKKMQTALNDQINAEMYSAYLYMAMAADFEANNLPGFGTWMMVQAQEEMTHARKIYDYINERGGRVTLKIIDQPPSEWETPLAAFQAAYEHEQLVTSKIHALVDTATSLKDHPTVNFLQWFVAEQVEEEASADEIVQQLTLMAEAPGALFMLDRELGRRVFTPPAAEGA